jgi:hypothetical protein
MVSSPAAVGPAPSRRSGWVVPLVLLVAAMAVLASLFVLHLPPFGNATPSSTAGDLSTGQTSTEAVAAAQPVAAHYGPGPWSPMLLAGADPGTPLRASTVFPANSFEYVADGSCVGHAEAGNESVVTMAGFDGDLAAGIAPSWLVVEMNTTGSMVFVLVLQGAAQALEFYAGPACALFELLGRVPSNAINSSGAAAAASSGGLLAFQKEHPGGSTTYVGAYLHGAGDWTVTYSTCPAAGNATNGSTYYSFVANVSMTNGSLLGSPYSQVNPGCGGLDLSGPLSSRQLSAASPGAVQGWGPSLANVLGVSSSVAESHGLSGYVYSVNVTSAASDLTWGDLEFSVRNASNEVPKGTFTVEMLGSGGCIVAEGAMDDPFYFGALFGGGCSGTVGNQAPVSAGETISITDSNSLAGAGDTFMIYSGSIDFSGNVTLPIA